MLIVNTNGHKNDLGIINYKVINFSDSQKQIVLEIDCYISKCVKITSRMSWDDLQLIILAVKALERQGVVNIYLESPYFLGARSDRLFERYSTHYLKDIICPIINFPQLSIVDCGMEKI